VAPSDDGDTLPFTPILVVLDHSFVREAAALART
jgi:hypothetical protein